jgi:hypothetical protein
VLAQRNGHAWLARQMAAEGIGYSMADNAFVRIDDWQRAQELADALSPDQLHRILDGYAEQCCPVSEAFGQSYHWSLMQVEYAADLASVPPPRWGRCMNNWSARAYSARKPSRLPASLADRSRHNWRRRSARSFPRGSRAPA